MQGDPTSNSGRTRGYIATLQFNENLAPTQRVDTLLACNPAQCGGQSSVHIRVIPEGQSHLVNWGATLQGGNGHILSKITNMDSVAYGPWNLAPHDTAYLWIGEIIGHPRDLGIIHENASHIFSFAKIATGKALCSTAAATMPAAHINQPGLCHGSFARGFDNSNRLASNSVIHMTRMLGHDQGLWQGCAQGCCETAFF